MSSANSSDTPIFLPPDWVTQTDSRDSNGTGTVFTDYIYRQVTEEYVQGHLRQINEYLDLLGMDVTNELTTYDELGRILTNRYDNLTMDYYREATYYYDNSLYSKIEFQHGGWYNTGDSTTYYDLDGNVVFSYTTDPNVVTEIIYDFRVGQGFLVTSHMTPDDPSLDYIKTTAQDGSVTLEQFGQNGFHRTLHYDALHRVIGEERFAADGTLKYQVHNGADGESETTFFDHGRITQSVKIDGKGEKDVTYFSGNQKTTEAISHRDGSRDISKYVNGEIKTELSYAADGSLEAATTHRTDGSLEVVAKKAGLALDGSAGNDLLVSAGDALFVFKGTFGNDTVKGFRAGDQFGHDTLVIQGSGTPTFGHLEFEQHGTDTIVHLDAGSITLKNVLAQSLTHNDFVLLS